MPVGGGNGQETKYVKWMVCWIVVSAGEKVRKDDGIAVEDQDRLVQD